ncbi:sensor histidine kinase [Enemella sp. A6]|uniref:sensor histidine kinase n=1 Tax=Enemella sp. A6 TaxID=3440152 RepID=UPI003EB9EC52
MATASFSRITKVLLNGLDVMLIGLVALAVATGAGAGNSPWLMAVLGATFLTVYVVGRVTIRTHAAPLDAPRGKWWPNGAWILLLIVLWAGLLHTSPSGLWVAFPLALLAMHALGPIWGGVAVAVATTMAIVHGLWSAPQVTLGTVLGPLLGSAVAVTVLLGLEGLARETENRQQLLDELSRARGWLAEAERERAVLGERERLAREIHDTLAQGLSAIDLLLRAAGPQIGEGSARELVERAGDTARQNLTEARRFVHALTPADLEHHPLPEAMRRAIEQAGGSNGLHAQLRIVGEPRWLPVVTEAAVLRILQSALANVTQHADATTVEATLTYGPNEVSLDVVDDGIGFDPSQHKPDGFGLRGIRSRVAELGGRVVVVSAPGDGTTVAVTLPYPEEDL